MNNALNDQLYCGFQILMKALRRGSGGHLEKAEIRPDGGIYLEGWARCTVENPPAVPVRLFAVLGSSCVFEIPEIAIQRPDVEAHFGIRSGDPCGFSAILPKVDPDLLESIELFSLSPSGSIYEFQHRIARSLLQLEIAGTCNLRCPKCPNVMYSSFHGMELEPENLSLAKQVLDRTPNVCFDGFSEGLIATYLPELIAAIPRHKKLVIHTNGMLLNQKMDVLLENAPPLRQLIVSIDSLVPERYAVIRRGGQLATVLANLRQLIAERRRRGQDFPMVMPNITITADNYHELNDFVRLAAELDGIFETTMQYDSLSLERMSPLIGKGRGVDYEQVQPRNAAEAIHTAFCEASELATQLGVTMQNSGYTFGALPNAHTDAHGALLDKRPIEQCPMLDSACVQADGKTMLCVWQTRPIFNWRTTGNMDPTADLRGAEVIRMIRQGRIPVECGGSPCPWVARRPSDDEHEPPTNFVGGGWQI